MMPISPARKNIADQPIAFTWGPAARPFSEGPSSAGVAAITAENANPTSNAASTKGRDRRKYTFLVMNKKSIPQNNAPLKPALNRESALGFQRAGADASWLSIG